MSPGTTGRQLPPEALQQLARAGMYETGNLMPGEVTIEQLRRRRLRRRLAPGEFEPGYVTLYEQDGVMQWDLDVGLPQPIRPGRASRRGAGVFELAGKVIHEFKFQPVEGSQVAALLDSLDKALNDQRGLREWTQNGLGPTGAVPKKTGEILLLVHGTFSKAQAMLDDLASFGGGKELTKRFAKYDQVLAFEHPTLAVSPFINARVLSRAFADSQAEVDIICHSRGGLVVLWWLEALRPRTAPRARAIFVGSPLGGTSLAAPHRLRRAMDHLTNVSFAAGQAGQLASFAIPWIGVFGGLLRLFSSASGFVARTPVVDMAVAMIPGLAAQSRMRDHNFEIAELRAAIKAIPNDYGFVRSNFEPIGTDESWKFLKFFTRLKSVVIDAGADLIFTDPNDLVVDCASMTELLTGANIAASQLCDFGDSQSVHHLNYFAQTKTVDFIIKRFGL